MGGGGGGKEGEGEWGKGNMSLTIYQLTSRTKLGQQMRSGGLSAYLSLNQKFNSCVMD